MGPGGTMPPHDPNWRSHSAEPVAADGFSGALKPPSRRRSRTALQVMLSLPPAALAFSPARQLRHPAVGVRFEPRTY